MRPRVSSFFRGDGDLGLAHHIREKPGPVFPVKHLVHRNGLPSQVKILSKKQPKKNRAEARRHMGTDRRPASPGNCRLMLLGSRLTWFTASRRAGPARSHIAPHASATALAAFLSLAFLSQGLLYRIPVEKTRGNCYHRKSLRHTEKGEVPMKLRKALPGDQAAVVALYREAQEFLRAQGIDQWQDGYPNAASFQQDVKDGAAWVREEGGRVVATACLAFGREPTYDKIYEGAWGVEAPGVCLPPQDRRLRGLQGQERPGAVLWGAGAPGPRAGPALPAGGHPPPKQDHAAGHGEKRPCLPGGHLLGRRRRTPGL